MDNRCRGLVVLDVDGVVFRGMLLLSLSRRLGRNAFIRTLLNCLRYDLGRISLEHLLDSVYAELSGRSIGLVWDIYRSMKITDGTAETVAALRTAGWKVVLASAGVPDFVMEDLVKRLGADGGAGMELGHRNGALTGKVHGELYRTGGKLAYAERIVRKEGFRWKDVVVVGDDRNNLALMKKAGLSIGFRPLYQVRQVAQFIVDEDDLSSIIGIIANPVPPEESEEHHPVPPKPWHQELRRKVIHALGAGVPLLAGISFIGVPAVLIVVTAIFLVSEILRVNGIRLPIVCRITRLVLRERERREVALGPLTLVLGIGASLLVFDRPVAYAAILIASFADSAAAVVGERWGRLAIPYSETKTVEGSLAFLAVSIVCAMLFVTPVCAVVGGAAAMLIESLNIRDWDNLLVPLTAGVAIQVAGMYR
jgi:dolichol kinase/phosphoserine phosphatase